MLTGHPPYFQNNARLATLSEREVFQWLTTSRRRRVVPALPAPPLISAHCANFVTLCLQYDPLLRPQCEDRAMRVHPFRLGVTEDVKNALSEMMEDAGRIVVVTRRGVKSENTRPHGNLKSGCLESTSRSPSSLRVHPMCCMFLHNCELLF